LASWKVMKVQDSVVGKYCCMPRMGVPGLGLPVIDVRLICYEAAHHPDT
jgi:hypothetical protein